MKLMHIMRYIRCLFNDVVCGSEYTETNVKLNQNISYKTFYCLDRCVSFSCRM